MSQQYSVYVTTAHVGNAVAYLKEHFVTECTENTVPLSGAELLPRLASCDAVVSVLEDRFNSAVFSACPNLKVVANVAVGYDNIDVDAATRCGVLVCNTPGVLDNTTADMAFGLLMSAARRIVEADRYVRSGQWGQWSTDLLLGVDVFAKTVGIVGLGRIGQAMARRACGFDMKILYTQRNRAPEELEKTLQAEFVSMDELLKRSDFVSLHCPLTPITRHLLGNREFALMKPSALLINTARGAVVDEKALVQALLEKNIAGAGLDVFEDEPRVPAELLQMDNVVVAPHIGSATVETRSAMARLAAEGVVSALNGKLPHNAVNPQVWEEFVRRLQKSVGSAG